MILLCLTSRMPIMTAQPELKNGEDFIVEVGYGEVFFLGDNRNKSTDSRVKGTRSVSDVLGVVPEWALKYRKMYEWYYNFIYHVNAAIFKNNCGA